VRRDGSRSIGKFEGTPPAVLGRSASRTADPQGRGNGDGERHRRQGSTDQLHCGANKNRTCDLCLIRAAL
jgi:hypothetical protein